MQALNESEALRSALEKTYAAHVHNAIQGVLVFDLIREVGTLILDDNRRSASVARAVSSLRNPSVVEELRADYAAFTGILGASDEVARQVHKMVLQQNLAQLDSLPDFLKKVEERLISGTVAELIRLLRNKAVAHHDVAHDGTDWRMWRIEGTGLTYGQLDEYINAGTHAVDRLVHLVLRTAYAFDDLPAMSQRYVDEYIEALVLGLTLQRERRQQKRPR